MRAAETVRRQNVWAVRRQDPRVSDIIPHMNMTEPELQRVIQYISGQLSYGLPITSDVLRTGFGELAALAQTTTAKLDRESIVTYICAYTAKKTGHPEYMVREILETGGRWLDQACEALAWQESKTSN